MKKIILIIGVLLIIGSFPTASMIDLSVNGCCSGQTKGFPYNFIAALPIVLMTVGGTVLTAYGVKYKKSR